MLLQKFVQQHRVHRFVAHAVRLALIIRARDRDSPVLLGLYRSQEQAQESLPDHLTPRDCHALNFPPGLSCKREARHCRGMLPELNPRQPGPQMQKQS
jgi:hypothetical protein